jgi:hypothetical protein
MPKISRKLIYLGIILLFSHFTFAETLSKPLLEIRKIIPPRLDTAYLSQKILCHRPMRNGMPNMSIEYIEDKIIAHNYGHGGSGWTLAPGSVKYVNNLLEKSNYAKNLQKDTPITIIGAGALGLFTAYDLFQKGYKTITIVAERFENLTSHNAGGLLAPVSMNNGSDIQKVIDQIGIEAYKFYKTIAKKTHPYFKEGAIIVPTYFKNRKESGLEPYVGIVMQPAKDVILDFGNGTTQEMVAYDNGIFIDTAKMMRALTNYLKPKVKFIQNKVSKFSEIQDSYIINCTGLGSKKLTQDKEIVSTQGHLIMLKNQNPQDLQYMLLVYLDEGETKAGYKIKRSFYIFPKKLPNANPNDVGVIGGTFIEDATSETPHQEEFDILLKGAKEFYGIH